MLDNKRIGRNISLRRKQLGKTQLSLAEELYVSYQAISSWERGESAPDITRLPQISKVLCCTIDELLLENSEKSESEVILKTDENYTMRETYNACFANITSKIVNGSNKGDFNLVNIFPLLSIEKSSELLEEYFAHFKMLIHADQIVPDEIYSSIALLSANAYSSVITKIVDDIIAIYFEKNSALTMVGALLPYINEPSLNKLIDFANENRLIELLMTLRIFIPDIKESDLFSRISLNMSN